MMKPQQPHTLTGICVFDNLPPPRIIQYLYLTGTGETFFLQEDLQRHEIPYDEGAVICVSAEHRSDVWQGLKEHKLIGHWTVEAKVVMLQSIQCSGRLVL